MSIETRNDGPILAVLAPDTRLRERCYSLDQVLGEWLGLRYELRTWSNPVVSITRLDRDDGRSLTMPDVLFSMPPASWLTERSLPSRPLRRVSVPVGGDRNPADRVPTEPLPVLYGDPDGPATAWEETSTGIVLSADVFGGAFALLARLEEAIAGTRDAHDRFPLSASLASAEGFVERPLVDDYVDLLWAALHATWPDLQRPADAFSLLLTHDIDRPWSALGRPISAGLRSVGGDLLKRRDPALAGRRLRSVLDARSGIVDRDPLNTFDFLMATSERHGLRSTFFFQAGTTPRDEDYRYLLTDAPFGEVLREIGERGHEIGLHGSYGSYASPDQVHLELEALQAACRAAGVEQQTWGGRQHYLRFRNPSTWRHHESAGLAYDSTLGFAEAPGFRSGTCREHTVFDLLASRPLALRERPLVVMDASLFGYLGLGYDAAARRACQVVAECRQRSGPAVVLYHNDSVAGDRAKAHYRELVEELTRPS